jgi:UDP-glucose 4-epimerase
VVNCGTGTAHTVAEFARLLVAAWGASCTIEFSGRARPGDPQSLVADVTRLRALAGLEPRSLADGLAAYVRWFRSGAGD